MRINKIIKSSVVICLLAVMIASFAGCNKPEVIVIGKLPNQFKNNRYYFQQGYRDDWTATFKEDEFALDSKYLRLFDMWPTAGEGNTLYSVYTGDTKLITVTVLDIVGRMTDAEDNLYVNTRFINGETPRENFKFTSDNEKVIYNKLQFQHAKYSFTKDGADWIGDFYVVMKGSKYYVILWERKADVGDTYQDQFIESIQDFRFLGFEDE